MTKRTHPISGFTIIEIAVVAAVILVTLTMALPLLTQTLRAYRAASDARNIAAQLALARMQAANRFTRARLNLVNSNTYRIELETNRGGCTDSTWAADGGSFTLQSQVAFGFTGVSVPAPPQTGTISQPANNVVIFNSRGVPVDCGGVPVGAYAIYLRNSSAEVFAVTVYPSSKTSVWKYSGSGWSKI